VGWAPDGSRALGIGNVVAFDAIRNGGKGEGSLQLSQGLGLLVLVRLPLRFESSQRLCGVLGSHLDEFGLLTLARNFDLHFFPTATGAQPLLDDISLLHFFRQKNLRRNI